MGDLSSLLDDPSDGLGDERPEVRRMAVAALAGAPEHFAVSAAMLEDDHERVRAAAAETLGTYGTPALEVLLGALDRESDESVFEAIATALGELELAAGVPALVGLATGSHETLTRESAVASLGAIGHESALPTLLDLVRSGPPQVRRRCVVALSVFDGPEVEAAIRHAREDRNPMVREAAEMVIGRT